MSSEIVQDPAHLLAMPAHILVTFLLLLSKQITHRPEERHKAQPPHAVAQCEQDVRKSPAYVYGAGAHHWLAGQCSGHNLAEFSQPSSPCCSDAHRVDRSALAQVEFHTSLIDCTLAPHHWADCLDFLEGHAAHMVARLLVLHISESSHKRLFLQDHCNAHTIARLCGACLASPCDTKASATFDTLHPKKAPQGTVLLRNGSPWACRLLHGAPSPVEAARIARKCPGLRELDATGCARCLPESLQALAHIPFRVGSACTNPHELCIETTAQVAHCSATHPMQHLVCTATSP